MAPKRKADEDLSSINSSKKNPLVPKDSTKDVKVVEALKEDLAKAENKVQDIQRKLKVVQSNMVHDRNGQMIRLYQLLVDTFKEDVYIFHIQTNCVNKDFYTPYIIIYRSGIQIQIWMEGDAWWVTTFDDTTAESSGKIEAFKLINSDAIVLYLNYVRGVEFKDLLADHDACVSNINKTCIPPETTTTVATVSKS